MSTARQKGAPNSEKRAADPQGEPAATELRRAIDYHAYRYYVLDDPEVGDDQYDAIVQRAQSD